MSLIKQNEPYILKVMWDDTPKYLIIAERNVVLEYCGIMEALTCIISSYYVLNINYPSQLQPILMFISQYIFEIKDMQGSSS